jgi:WD40 repeat protein
VATAVFTDDGQHVITGSFDGTVKIWRVTADRTLRYLTELEPGDEVTMLALTHTLDGREILAVAGIGSDVILWDVSELAEPDRIAVLEDHPNELWAATLSPDGETLAVGGYDGRVWLYDVRDPEHPEMWTDPLGTGVGVLALDFDAESKTLAAGLVDGVVRLWDTSDPGEPRDITDLVGHEAEIHTVAFAPDGRTLFSGALDHAVHIWNTDPVSVGARLCAVLPALVNEENWASYFPNISYEPYC